MTTIGRNSFGNMQYQCDFCKGEGVVPLDDDKHHACLSCLRACASYVLDMKVPVSCITMRVEERLHRAAIKRVSANYQRNTHSSATTPTGGLTSNLPSAPASAMIESTKQVAEIGGVPVLRTRE